jgi:hypothetical protein
MEAVDAPAKIVITAVSSMDVVHLMTNNQKKEFER